MADGHINLKYRLKVALALKDKEHLVKFMYFMGKDKLSEENENYVSVNIMDTKNFKLLCDKFAITNDKTIIPCDINSIEDNNLLMALIIGFIDGDGTIVNKNRKNRSIRIKCHNNWLNNLDIMSESIEANEAYTNNQGYATLHITNKICKRMKAFAIENNLPLLERKWSFI